uniref:Ubiquitin-like domain-containing protein n=1 Tax=Monopterus albus TaxID=43700 RepID=A0A3Q3IS81_MONAL
MGKTYQLQVFGIAGEMKTIDLCTTEEEMQKITVLQLRKKVTEKFPIEQTEVQMIFTDKMLDNDSALLSSYGIKNFSAIQLVMTLRGGGSD